jgi:hypothetical protein
MPVRPRRQRRSRHALTLDRYMALSIGPRTDEPLDELRAVFAEHRRRFDDGDWAVQVFEKGLPDYREPHDAGLAAGVGCPGLPG